MAVAVESLLEIASKWHLCTQKHFWSLLIFLSEYPKPLIELASKPFRALDHCSILLRSTNALKIKARVCLFYAQSRRNT